jgi:glycosyltransferase involved in cell wall biosynthesis
MERRLPASRCRVAQPPQPSSPAHQLQASFDLLRDGGDWKLRIAQVAPLSLPVPPLRYGGTERVVATLTEGLSQRGHEITLFVAGTSLTSARLHATVSRPLWEMQPEDPLAYRVLQVEELVRESRRFDVIHSHVDYLPWLAGDRIAAPMVTTLHGPLDVPELRPPLQCARRST